MDNQLASPQARLGSFLLEIGLMIVTLFIGWVIWSFFTWQTGQTPAKRILKQAVVSAKDDQQFQSIDQGALHVDGFLHALHPSHLKPHRLEHLIP